MENCTSIRKEDDAVVAVGIEKKEDSGDDSPPSSPSLISSSVPPTSGFGGDDGRQEDSPPPPSSSSSTTSQTNTSRVGVKIERDEDDDEYRYWLNRVRRNGYHLRHAPEELQNDKKIVMEAVKKSRGWALQFASPSLRNDKQVVLAAVKQEGRALQYASPSLRSDKQVVMAAVKNWGRVLRYASPSLQNDKQVVMEAVKQWGGALEFASPTLQNDLDVVVAAVAKDSKAINFVSPELLNDPNTWSALIRKNVVSPELLNGPMNWSALIRKKLGPHYLEIFLPHSPNNGKRNLPLIFAPDHIRRDKAVILAAAEKGVVDTLDLTTQELRDDKDFALMWVKANPDNIKFINDNLKRDPEIMVASGMYDSTHVDAKTRTAIRQQQMTASNQQDQKQQRKIVLSTRFALNATGTSVATTFTKLFKDHDYIRDGGNFIVYCPNAFDKKTCDPNWTDINWPCRGTKETCRGWIDDLYGGESRTNVLTVDGFPTDYCCWRYSFRNQLQEAKDTGGLMIQLIEKDHGETSSDATPKLGKGQEIEFQMAKELKMKIYKVYVPKDGILSSDYVNTVVRAIQKWYSEEADDGTCRQDDMTGYMISGFYQAPVSYF